jgi:Ala-tRNA(Pro) deacylase
MVKYHKTVGKIKALLDESGVDYECFEHEAVRTSEEAQKVRNDCSLKQGAKAIIIKVKKNGEKSYKMLVMPGDKKFDSKKIKKELGFKNTSFASEEEVKEVTGGILPGGVPPFGNLFGIKVFVDKSLFDNKEIVFNAGDRRFSIKMTAVDYKKIVDPQVVSIC